MGRVLGGRSACAADSAACSSVYGERLNNFPLPSAPGSRSKAPQEWNRVSLAAAEVGGTDSTWPQDSCPGLIVCRAFGTKAKLRPISAPWAPGSLRLSGRAPWGPPSWNSRGEFQRCGMRWDGWCGFSIICGLQRPAGGMGCGCGTLWVAPSWGRGGAVTARQNPAWRVVELQFRAGRAATPTNKSTGHRLGSACITLPPAPSHWNRAKPGPRRHGRHTNGH